MVKVGESKTLLGFLEVVGTDSGLNVAAGDSVTHMLTPNDVNALIVELQEYIASLPPAPT
jgi:hypothetical protein